jgi:hypothetical protein
VHGAGGYQARYYGGYRGYYGYRGGYGGGYGYRGWYGGYYPWALAGVGLGLYSAYGYGGIPYYYAGNPYFSSEPTVGQYVTVAQPAGAPNRPGPMWSELIVYPKNGQSQYQQATDRYECYRWAVLQLGYDPTSAGVARCAET